MHLPGTPSDPMHKGVVARSLFCVLLLALLIAAAGCSDDGESGKGMPAVLKIGIPPDESKATLLKRYTPLFKYLSRELGIPYELKISTSYKNLLELFEKGDIDLAHFGGFTFIQAYHKHKAVPLVMRDIDTRFTSYFVTRADIPLRRLPDFKGKTFSFGSKLSTSGHLMPRYFLNEEMGIVPEKFFSKVQYSGSHDKTAIQVQDGIVDIGAANSKIIDKMLRDGRLSREKIRILWESPPYADYVWVLQSGFNKTTRMKIRNAFLALSPSIKTDAAILSKVDAAGFLPASFADFEQLNRVAEGSVMHEEIHKH